VSHEVRPQVAEVPAMSKHIIPTPMRIGFLGLGIMGSAMVGNLLKSGHEVTVWNRTPQKCRDYVKDGAIKGNTPSEVVQNTDITFSCVADPTALKDLVFGNSGVLQGIGPGKGYIDMSTVDVDTITDVSEAVMARGGRFLEAPVSGSKGPALAGELIILASGDRTLYEDATTCFQAMGKKTFFLGETGNGVKMKLVVNMMMGTVMAGLAEAMSLAEKIGLDQDELLQVLDLSSLASPIIRSKGNAIMSSKFETNFPLQHQQKDLRLCINMADAVDQPLHVTSAANELFKKAKAKGYGEHDVAAVYRAADM
jgi:3-hydroxyisobutyrate dehydrogenase-like beta-hydroxyacid dehydrogenase